MDSPVRPTLLEIPWFSILLLGIAGSGVSLISSLISKDLVDIITGHQTGKLLATFAAMIGFSLANILGVSGLRATPPPSSI